MSSSVHTNHSWYVPAWNTYFLYQLPPTLSLNVSAQNRDKGKRRLFINQRVFLHTADESWVVGGCCDCSHKEMKKTVQFVSTQMSVTLQTSAATLGARSLLWPALNWRPWLFLYESQFHIFFTLNKRRARFCLWIQFFSQLVLSNSYYYVTKL